MFNNYDKKFVVKENLEERKKTSDFLANFGISFDETVDITVNMLKNNSIIASASAERNLIKCLCVNPEFRSEGLINEVLSDILKYKFSQGFYDLSLFTKPENESLIKSLGFYTICQTKNIVFMENNKNKFSTYIENLPSFPNIENIASIVMNLNPITNGHLFLIEKASKENDLVCVFIVSEDRSAIPFSDRYELAKSSISHLENVILIKGGDYIISSTTFPSYFTKDYNEWLDNYCELDLTLFGEFISKKIKISKRYVGSEPYCTLTNHYNNKMKDILSSFNIQLMEVARLNHINEAISASKVRKLADEGNFELLKILVPEATYKYLISKGGGNNGTT